MRHAMITLTLLLSLLSCSKGIDLSDVASNVASAGFELSDIDQYPGSCFMQGVSEYAQAAGDKALEGRLVDTLDKFLSGHLLGKGSLISYSIGGTAMAQMALWGHEAYAAKVIEVADSMFRVQPRNNEDVMIPAWNSDKIRPDGLFVDMVFAATPYLLYAGLLSGRQEWIDYAAWMTLKTFDVLRDEASGLVHQARGVLRLAEGEISRDCWSRGNGWGSIALAALIRDLPASNPYYQQVHDLAADFFAAVLRYQDAGGLWHQEMTFPDCWQETSGSALLLYGIGTAIDCGILPKSAKTAFVRGLEGLLAFIDTEGNVACTCGGCLAVGDSSKETYAIQVPYWNERHAFGPVMLALSAAARLGIRTVDTTLGSKVNSFRPACLVRHVEERKDDLAWENDWSAYRIYSQKAPLNKISSGIDYWAKKVDYPILDKWYAANAGGGSYHKDQGEGYDFYAVGKRRGVGGNGVWSGDSLYVSLPYEQWEITEDGPERISFTVSYPPFRAGEETVRQTTTYSCALGSPFTRVETTLTSESGNDLTLAVGLTTFGRGETKQEIGGVLRLYEYLPEEKTGLHSILITDPALEARRADAGPDKLLLMDIHSGQTVRYYFSAFSSLTNRSGNWHRIVTTATYNELNRIQ